MISNTDNRWLDVAMGVALASNCQQRVGAVLVIGGNPIVKPNRRHRHGCLDQFPWSVHAEAHTLRYHPSRGGTMYVARITPGDKPGLAKPCERCVEAMTEHAIRRVVWTTGDPHHPHDSARMRDLAPSP